MTLSLKNETLVQAVVMEHLGVNAEQVTAAANFRKDLGADSLDRIEMFMACEEVFGLEIEDCDAEQIETVRELHAYLALAIQRRELEQRLGTVVL